MGYAGRLEDKLKAQELRRGGYSYKEIREKVVVSKGTLSLWCRDIELTEDHKQRLMGNKLHGQKKGSLVAAENKRRARIVRIETINKQSLEDLGEMTIRDKMLLGIALYAGEGYKKDGRFGFANADPALISFMMDWIRTFFEIPEDKLRGALWLHEGLDAQRAEKFWSSLTGIPLNQFHKTYVAKVKADSKKIRKNIHEYGIFTIVISNSAMHRQIMGWIYAAFGDKIAK